MGTLNLENQKARSKIDFMDPQGTKIGQDNPSCILDLLWFSHLQQTVLAIALSAIVDSSPPQKPS